MLRQKTLQRNRRGDTMEYELGPLKEACELVQKYGYEVTSKTVRSIVDNVQGVTSCRRFSRETWKVHCLYGCGWYSGDTDLSRARWNNRHPSALG